MRSPAAASPGWSPALSLPNPREDRRLSPAPSNPPRTDQTTYCEADFRSSPTSIPLPNRRERRRQTRNTSENVEIHYDKITGNTARRGGDWSSLYPSSTATTGTWLMAPLTSASGKPDLVLIQTANTRSGYVELSCATGASNYSKSGGHWISAFDTDSAAGTWCLADMDGDGRLDLVRIKTADTTSGQIEVYYASAASGYQTIRGGASEFNLADGANGVWEVLPAA